MTELVVLEHTAGAGASAFELELDRAPDGPPWRRLRVPDAEPLPAGVDGLAGLVVMGGTMSAVAPEEHPWMPAEIALLRRAVAADVPVLGVCLGAQLLGQALGGEVVRREVPEVAYVPLNRTPAGRHDEVVGRWHDGDEALFAHEDEVARVPTGADVLLTGSDGAPAWRIGSALAVQFHPEITAEQIDDWVERGALDDLFGRAGVVPTAVAAEARHRAPAAVAAGRALLRRFLDGPVRRRLRRSAVTAR